MTLLSRTIHQPAASPLGHLDAVLAAEWHHGDRPAAIAAMQKAVKADKTLHAALLKRRQELEALDAACQGQIKRRCAVSAVHLKALREALG